MAITVTGLSKKYGKQVILDQVSFSISDREIVAFLGANGAGKSTTLKILSGFLLPDAGEILINGMDLRCQLSEIQRKIGYLPENNPLYPEMYVREYLAFVASLFRLGKTARQAIDRAIALTGLESEASKRIGRLSKGYKQRVGLAQAILHCPSVLLLDEPTTGLDPVQLQEVRRLLADLARECSILFSTHNLNETAQLCSHIIIINNGKIAVDSQWDGHKSAEELERLLQF
ncbi:MAG: ABC transporter ATP-binding protein [Bacteroidales bacterium]|jgi:ABC-2 type transport system ATP-binding protein|nr:ABC transporter ATP-binding protein [Bacteroidales bacterium]